MINNLTKGGKMQELSKKQEEILKFLNEETVIKTTELAKKVDMSTIQLRLAIKQLRKKFLAGEENIDYIYTTKGGYTTRGSKEDVMYESQMRLKLGIGVLVNGVYVFKRCKKIAKTDFSKLNIAYKPKMLTLNNVIK